jgi:hypothetical protein
MTDEYRSLIESKRTGVKSPADSDDEAVERELDEFDCYSLVSSGRTQKLMLDFRLNDGNSFALAYSYLVGISFNPSEGIELDFGMSNVKVTGINLMPIYSGLVAQRVAWLRELVARDFHHAPDGKALVRTIELIPKS